jgi:Helix-turn-helix domain
VCDESHKFAVVNGEGSTNGRSRHSLFERILWTFALDPADRNVLGALAQFGSYKTGRGARPSLETLAERCRVHPRNVRKSLRRMEAAGYLVRHPRTHLSSVYDINLNKLAVDMRGTVEEGVNAPLDDEEEEPKEEGVNAPLRGGREGVYAPPKGGANGPESRLRGALTPSDPPVRTDPPVQNDPPVHADPPKVPRRSAPTPSENPETTTAPSRGVWNGIGQVRQTGAARTIHERRTKLIAKVLRTLLERRGETWPDHHAVKVALRAELQRREILPNLDYGQAHFDDAIAIVNTATPFIGKGAVH